MQIRNPETLGSLVGRGPSKMMSGRELARRVAVHPSMINHLTSGRCLTCSDELAAKIEQALGVQKGVIFMPDTTTGAMRESAPDYAGVR